jgi:hypothetical protein
MRILTLTFSLNFEQSDECIDIDFITIISVFICVYMSEDTFSNRKRLKLSTFKKVSGNKIYPVYIKAG